MDTLELLLHPVRLRILHAMSGGRIRTTSELCASLPDVSKATVYRQVALLVKGRLLEVEGERRVHGAVERRYRLNRSRAVVGPDAAASMSLQEHRHGFAAAMAGLVAEFNAYLDGEHADPTADSVGYRQIPLWLSPEELADLIEGLRSVLAPKMRNAASDGRGHYLLSPILFPIEALPRHTTAGRASHRGRRTSDHR